MQSVLVKISLLIFLLFASAAPAAPATQPYLLHIPGIGGHLPLDDHLIQGLHDGGIAGKIELYDWTGADRGLMALMQEQRHAKQSEIVAKMLAQKAHAFPGIQITVTSHSGGCGIAVWALEKLPDDVVIENLLMMQSALSPDYDLSKALRHVHHAYSLYSELDSVVLGTGTRTAGTVDGVYSDAAGRVGYKMPATADARQYQKLKQFEYQDEWMQYGDIGDHIGPMRYRFAKSMIVPLLQTGELPKPPPLTPATTQATIEPSTLNTQH
ncbi:MAG TPA: hypothetical protein VHS31_16590 [Tepidisphaeraceae bacterium]|jgi:hypothetical protein|nr:hypothetical protein [Tepidisphaeraceae bacterium]